MEWLNDVIKSADPGQILAGVGGAISVGAIFGYLLHKFFRWSQPKQALYNLGWSLAGRSRKAALKINDLRKRADTIGYLSMLPNYFDGGWDDRLHGREKKKIK